MRVCRNLVLVRGRRGLSGFAQTYSSINQQKRICVHLLNLRRLRAFPQFDTSSTPFNRRWSGATPAVNNNPSREIFREKVCPLIKKC